MADHLVLGNTKSGTHTVAVTNSSLIGLKTHSVRGNTTPGTGNLDNYPGLVKSWILNENL